MLNAIITDILKAEGWDAYTNRPNDRGGPTKWGITLKSYSEYLGRDATIAELQAITEAGARRFYLQKYVVGPKFSGLPEPLRGLVVDCGVNHGPRAATKWVQRAIGARQDGVLGPRSFDKLKYNDPLEVALRVLSSRVRLFGRIVTRDPTQAENAHGWNNRAAKWLERLADYYMSG